MNIPASNPAWVKDFCLFAWVENNNIQDVPRVVENNETGNSRGKMQQILLCDIFR